MKMAVKLYKDLPNPPKGIPGEWPAMCLELEDHEECLEGWHEMPLVGYHAYRDAHQHKFDAWVKSHDPGGRWRVSKKPHHAIKRMWRKLVGKF